LALLGGSKDVETFPFDTLGDGTAENMIVTDAALRGNRTVKMQVLGIKGVSLVTCLRLGL